MNTSRGRQPDPGARPEKIELTEEWELIYWTQHFDTDEQTLRAAIEETGNIPDQVKRHLESRR
ncbi:MULTISPECIES: DUF3606 domain-containing protein [Pseudoxanthomonas]|jgi:hypothetical protein|uniref:DUF3606 domain-containing protein n=1 Tax=Pseudoxanthomonas winnipegensis TaxID=2480810 RepID=A0A4Q8L4X8_9GAMM|nr:MULTISPECIES: DUF3606 domain-containing protein [Pseudoxanthomonas]PZP61984.1 MAG: hypothetical protein DI597_08365 [Pseudoxanthomonas spadix]TAA19113.1 DUF3606 domain-containing protein [Pseudoxanthomonas winnipegensis]TMN24742.1 DUF3606 domain-containing protein [Pseudoxanthomonas sp. X-1]UAY73172.1 DUF3606 domain-containing protein [Pseudoxanthomonas sp. X-1]